MAVGKHVTHTGLYVFKGRVNYHGGDKKKDNLLISTFPTPCVFSGKESLEKRGQWTSVFSDEGGYSVQTRGVTLHKHAVSLRTLVLTSRFGMISVQQEKKKRNIIFFYLNSGLQLLHYFCVTF